MMITYNGWTNFGTYKIKYQFFNSSSWVELMNDPSQVIRYADILKLHLRNIIESEGCHTTSYDFANAFLDTVNFIEIAESLIQEFNDDHI